MIETTDLELSKKLNKAGIEQESGNWWKLDSWKKSLEIYMCSNDETSLADVNSYLGRFGYKGKGSFYLSKKERNEIRNIFFENTYSAFTLGELKKIAKELYNGKVYKEYWRGMNHHFGIFAGHKTFKPDTELQAWGEYILHLKNQEGEK